MRELKKRVEFEADTCNVGYNQDSNDVLIELTETGLINKVCYMYLTVDDANELISLLTKTIKEVTPKK